MGKVAEAIGASARLCALVAIGLAAIVAGNAARGQAPAPGSYYTCKDPSGKTVRSSAEAAIAGSLGPLVSVKRPGGQMSS